MLIAVLNGKGGVGKSTIAVHAAAWLRGGGVPLAVVDADAQASTSEWLAEAEPDLRVERCDTLAALRERLPRLTAAHDVVLADGPAAIAAESVVLAAAADLVLLPIGPSLLDIRASYRTARLLYKVRLRGPRPNHPQVVTILNRVNPRTRMAQLALAAVANYGFPVAETALHQRQAYAEAVSRGTVVWRMGPGAEPAAREMAALLGEVLDGPLAAAGHCRRIVEPACRPSSPPPAGNCPRSLPLSAVLTTSAPDPMMPASRSCGAGIEPAAPGVPPSRWEPTTASSCSIGASTPTA